MTVGEVWDADQLMGKTPYKGFTLDKSGRDSKGVVQPHCWGLPGFLSPSDYDCFAKFKAEVEKRGGDFRSTVYCFGEEEGEAWCLLRWCRARKFNYDDVIKMIEEATVTRAEAAKQGFYPDPKAALGCDMSLYFAQFPQLYSGFAKNGAPLFISKPGVLNVDAVEQITTLEGILEFHWYIMMHDFGDRLRQRKESDPNFKRFECVCVLDLENLTTSQLTSRSLAIIKTQAAVDSLCFPETMSKMIIINGPMFFSATWSLIKGWLDPRTGSKIDVISSRSKWEKRLLELVDAESLPSDYGGKGPDTKATLASQQPGDMKRLSTEVMYIRGSGSATAEIAKGEALEISIWTRSTTGGVFSVTDQDKKLPNWVTDFEIKHVGGSEASDKPSEFKLTKTRIMGPAKVKVKCASNAGRFTTNNFLVAWGVYPN